MAPRKKGKKRGEKMRLQEESTKPVQPEKVIHKKADPTLDRYYKALKAYYTLKKKYETNQHKLKHKIFGKDTSWVEKREEYKRKKRCVACGQTGGTQFKCINGIYTTNCGNQNSPCELTIQLKRPNIVYIPDEITEMNHILERIKLNIIQTKLSLLFGLKDEETASSEFLQFRENYKEGNTYITELTTILNNADQLKVKKSIINEAEKTFYSSVETMKELIRKYETDNDITNIKALVEIYVNDVLGIQTLIRKNQHSIVEVYYNHPSNPNIYRLSKIKKK